MLVARQGCNRVSKQVGVLRPVNRYGYIRAICNRVNHYSLSLICQTDIRGHEAPHHHQGEPLKGEIHYVYTFFFSPLTLSLHL